MLLDSWPPLATGLARYVREFLPDSRRGARPIRLPGGQGQIAGVFGKDGYTAGGPVKQEVAVLRRQLRDAALEELGFGLSEDGHAWAILVLPAAEPSQSGGKEGAAVLSLTTFLDQTVWRRGGSPADPRERIPRARVLILGRIAPHQGEH